MWVSTPWYQPSQVGKASTVSPAMRFVPFEVVKAREFQKNICFFFIDYTKAFDYVENCAGDGNSKPPHLPLEKPICRSGNKLELDMEQQTGSKYEKEYVKAVYCHPAYLTYMQSTS